MASNQSRSPRPGLTPLASTSSIHLSHSNPPSPLASPSSSTFSFSSAQTTMPYRSGSYSSNEFAPPPSSTTARFHEALAAKSRHAANPSSSSSSSSGSETAFRFPPDSASPSGERVFGALQRELGGGSSGVVGLGFAAREGNSREPSPRFGRSGLGDAGDRFYEEPESLDGYGGYEDPIANNERIDDEEFGFEEALRNAGYTSGVTPGVAGLHGIGRPASMDMGAEFGGMEVGENGDAERSFDFLLSPPPSVEGGATVRGPFSAPPPTVDPTMTVRPLATSTSSSTSSTTSDATTRNFSPNSGPGTPKASDRPRERTFPAPLLLGKDRPFGGVSNSPSTTAPLSLPRKTSVSTGSVSASPTPSRSPWNPSASMPPSSSSTTSSFDPTRAKEHRTQHSSQSSITYTHSHNASSASIASPTVGSSASFSSITNLNGHPSTSSEPPIGPQALLLFVLALRSASAPMALSQSQGPLSRSNTPLFSQNPNHQRIKSASSATSENEDGGSPTRAGSGGRLDTVDLSHKRIAEVPIEVIDELKDEVEKLALGYNLIRELPAHFSVLGKRLRYLNVRVNMLTIFPPVLCDMPSLEILDISRNKIKKLPAIPGTLLNLKVFSIAKNRVKRLPPYLAQMKHLKVLKIDHNPLEWPPKEITLFPTSAPSIVGSSASSVTSDGDGNRRGASKVEDAEEMQRWLPTLQKYIRDNAASQIERRIPKRASFQLPSDDDPYATNDERQDLLTRSLGMARTDSGRLLTSPPGTASSAASRVRITPPSTANGRSLVDEDQALRGIHSRNASHSTAQALEPDLRPSLKAKKSLPDLRQSHADILAERRTGGGTTDEDRAKPPPASALRRLRQERPGGIVHAASARAALSTQNSLATTTAPASATPPLATTAATSSSSRIQPAAGQLTPKATPRRPLTPTSLSRNEMEGPGSMKRPDMDRSPAGFDRNSGAYFRRLSMLPASTISKAVPTTLLEFADAIRGILFSLSQVYAALRQFVVFASQDRLPAPLAKLMGSADGTTSLLINALDRFDSLSRRGTPSPAIVRDVFVTCRDNVVTFGKLVAALKPELKSFTATADVRYTRTLLLMLYGSTGEIAKSWNAVSPLLQDMDAPKDDEGLATLVLQPPTPSPTLESGNPTASRPGPTPAGAAPPNGMYRTRSRTRRHAGSFSVEDVQLGAVLAPAPGLPPPSAGATPSGLPEFPPYSGPSPISPTSIPTASFDSSTIKGRPINKPRPGAPGMIMLPPQPKDREGFMPNSWEQQLTPGGTGWLNLNLMETEGPNSNGYLGRASPNLGYQSQNPPTAPTPSGSFSLPRNDGMRAMSTANADELFLNMVDPTTSIAFDVYAMVLDSFDTVSNYDEVGGGSGDLGPRRTKELTDICINGNEATVKLTGTLGRINMNNNGMGITGLEAKRLGDDAYAFVQWVIRLGKMIKAMSLEHRFAPRIREGVGQLTIATKEFAKHLQATSFRPLVAPSSSNGGGSTVSNNSGSTR